MIRGFTAAALAFACGAASAGDMLSVTYLKMVQPAPATLSNLDPIPEDLGLRGAELGLVENQTTGRFLGQDYGLEIVEVAEDDAPEAAARVALQASHALILDGTPQQVLAIADLPEAAGAVLFNVAAADVALRSEACRGNLLHTLPSDAMIADALSQFLVAKRWTKTAMVAGPRPEDQALAAAFETSLKKFGLKPGKRADWSFDADLRRSASQEVPLFTQGLGEYDVLLVADKLNDFARYVAFNTWVPRPLAGSEGLRPVAWGRAVEQWGAAQLQNRFRDLADRDMEPVDYAAWAAMRALGEARTRTGSTDMAVLKAYLLSDAFELGGFKGQPLSFRAWNGQLRQPIPLVTATAVVATAPLEGFLHQHNELDSLGLDQPDSACKAFTE